MARGAVFGKNTCVHVDRPHYAHGKCEACYRYEKRRRDPEFQARESRRLTRRALTQSEKRREWLYGVPVEQYAEMLEEQGGVCAICCEPPGARQLHVDHDHSTGRVRALLCSRCNTALGLMRDRPELLLQAAVYLELHTTEE